MGTWAILLTLGGVLAVSVRDVAQRYVLKEKLFSEKEIRVFQWTFTAVALAALWLLGDGMSASKNSNPLFWGAVILVTVTNFFIQPALVRSKKRGAASLTASVASLTPFLLTIVVLLLHEKPTWQGGVGIGLISFGNYAHLRENATTLTEWLLPFSWLFVLPKNFETLTPTEQEKVLSDRSALHYAYGAAILGTFGLIGEALTAREGDLLLGFAIQSTILAIAFASISFGQETFTASFVTRWQQYKKPLLIIGTCGALHLLLMGLAFRIAPVAYVGSLKRLSIVVVVVLSIYVLKEAKARKRLWPAVVVTVGSMLLVFDGSTDYLVTLIQRNW